MAENPYLQDVSDAAAAQALVEVIGESRWEAVALSHGYLALMNGVSEEEAARIAYSRQFTPLKRAKEILSRSREASPFSWIKPRARRGSAENPITKMFPAAITEDHFVEMVDELLNRRHGLALRDDRDSQNLSDFTLLEENQELPINIKNAGTRFERARQLVGIDPDDCIPIPAYKAYGALEDYPNLLYLVSVDYSLLPRLDESLPRLLSRSERIVWGLLQELSGARVRDAEDRFVYSMTRKHWNDLKALSESRPFRVISARKSIRILQQKPQRTPGIGLKAWGTGASAEVNVHIQLSKETRTWSEVGSRIADNGLSDIIEAVNRKRTEVVYDPEI
jgi:hypothetical protein